ncbi:MAG: undecaprenyl phosphate translocase family protein, partial [Phycisphaerae bacterium]
MSAPRATGSDAVARAPAKDSRSDAADSSGAMAKRSGAMPRENMPARSPRPPLVRSAIGGVLMGLANLVPGVSGGTMILVVGLYDEFIAAVADVSRLRFTRRNTMFLAVVVAAAAAAIVSLAGTLGRAVEFHRAAMFSLFIGLTLGGAPSIIGRIRLRSASAIL